MVGLKQIINRRGGGASKKTATERRSSYFPGGAKRLVQTGDFSLHGHVTFSRSLLKLAVWTELAHGPGTAGGTRLNELPQTLL
jgi:hypothetical protein